MPPSENTIEKINPEDQNMDAAEAILEVLLSNPSDFERKEAPSGICKNFMCTFNHEIIPMELAKADDNGAYIQTGSPKRFYYVTFENGWKCTTARRENDEYYVNERIGAKYEKKFVPASLIYHLTRIYRQNKHNRTFVQMFATARRAYSKEPMPYYFMSYRWTDGTETGEDKFVVSRHGNAKRPHAATYLRQNPAAKKRAIEMLEKDIPCANVYRDLIKEAKVRLNESKFFPVCL